MIRAAPPPEAIENERLSVRIERVCKVLDVSPRQVGKLIAAGEIEAHKIGARGIRVYLDSLADFRERQKIVPKGRRNKALPPVRPPPSAASRAAHNAAVAELRKMGLL